VGVEFSPVLSWRPACGGYFPEGRATQSPSLACRKAKDLGYPHELWTTRLLAGHAREHGPAQGQPCLAHLAQGTVCKILDEEDVKPHNVRYYLERRDPEFSEKMAEVLCSIRSLSVVYGFYLNGINDCILNPMTWKHRFVSST
jgi:hypothetical protein